MSPPVPNLIRWLLALVGATCTLTTEAQGPPGPRQKPAEVKFTEPDSPTASTNQAEATPKIPGLRGLDSTIRKPFELFNASDSFSGTMSAPPHRVPPPPPSAKRQKEIDLKKNWMFSTQEEIYGVQTLEEMLNVPEFTADGERKKARNTIERYIERAENARTAAISNRMSSERLAELAQAEDEEAKSKSDADEKPVLSFLFSPKSPGTNNDGAAQGFNQPFAYPGGGRDRGAGDFLSFIRPEQNNHPMVKSAAQETSMLEWKKLLDAQSIAPPAFNSGFGISTPALTFSPGTATLEPGNPRPLTRSPLTTPLSGGLALPSYTPANSGPMALPAPAPRFPPPAPVFEVPKRKF